MTKEHESIEIGGSADETLLSELSALELPQTGQPGSDRREALAHDQPFVQGRTDCSQEAPLSPSQRREDLQVKEEEALHPPRPGVTTSPQWRRAEALNWRQREEPLQWRRAEEPLNWRQREGPWHAGQSGQPFPGWSHYRGRRPREPQGRARTHTRGHVKESEEGPESVKMSARGGDDAAAGASPERPEKSMVADPPLRKDPGKKGRVIPLLLNHVEILISSQEHIYMYDVDFSVTCRSDDGKGAARHTRSSWQGSRPGGLAKEKRRKLIQGYLFREEIFRDVSPAFDGNKVLYTNERLHIPIEGKSFNFLAVLDDNEDNQIDVKVSLREVKAIDTALLKAYVSREFRGPNGSSLEIPQEPLRAINAVFRAAFEAAGYLLVGSDLVDPQAIGAMQCGPFDIHDGTFFSMRPQRWTIRLNVDKTQSALHRPMSLVAYVCSWRVKNSKKSESAASRHPLDPREVRMMEAELRGLRVFASHFKSASGKSYSRKFTIAGLSRQSADECYIKDLNLTVAEYTRITYDVRLRYPHWPCVCTNKEKKTMFPLELMTLEPYQRAPNRTAEFSREILRSSAIPVFKRRAMIEKAAQSLKTNKCVARMLSQYFINVNPRLCRANGRVLSPPQLQSGRGDVQINSDTPGKWIVRDQFFAASACRSLFVLNLSKCGHTEVLKFISFLLKLGREKGMALPDPCDVSHFKWDPELVENYFRKIKARVPPDQLKSAMVVVVLPYTGEAYGVIKFCGDVQYGISTQCIKEAKVLESNPQVVHNILLKMNAKLNGVNWNVKVSQGLDAPIREPFIVFGADVTHPSPTGNRKISKSIAAVVASCDPAAMRYSAAVRAQTTTHGRKSKTVIEMINNLDEMVKDLLKTYYRRTGLKPVSLIFYRDGVSEGQFREIIQKEVAAIQKACQSLEAGYQPGITFIVVQKRHHTRLFPANEHDGVGKAGNVPAGTVVDTDIVHPREFDFFMCAHEGFHGTSRPTHYHVLWDDNNWGSDDLQNFTFYLCHAYMRCSRSVSYPASTYYAHLAAFRARSVHGDFDASDSGIDGSGASSRGTKAVGSLTDIKDENITPVLNDRQYWI